MDGACFPGDNGFCWVCESDKCPFPTKTEDKKTEQLALFEYENPNKCGECRYLQGGICLLKSQDSPELVYKMAENAACYAFDRLK